MNSKRRPFSLMLFFLLTISLSSLPSLARSSSTSRIALHQENGEQRQGLERRFRSLSCFFHCLPSSSAVSFIHSLQEDLRKNERARKKFEEREQLSFVYLAIFLENLLLKASLSHSFSSFCLHDSLRETLSAVFYGLMRVLYVVSFFLTFFLSFCLSFFEDTIRQKGRNCEKRGKGVKVSWRPDATETDTWLEEIQSLLINQEFGFSSFVIPWLFLVVGPAFFLLLFHELLVNDAYHVMTEALLQLNANDN